MKDTNGLYLFSKENKKALVECFSGAFPKILDFFMYLEYGLYFYQIVITFSFVSHKNFFYKDPLFAFGVS